MTLTPTEQAVLQSLREGNKVGEAAKELGMSRATINRHLDSIRFKFDARTTVQAVFVYLAGEANRPRART